MSDHVLMKGMLGVMLAAMVSATLSTVSGTLNVFANVFTYDIYGEKHLQVGERGLIRIGRIFTFVFGAAIIALALLIPYAGGAEKVVVTVLTMIIGPLYIPSVWGVYSRRLTQRHVLWAMGITYLFGIFGLAFKFNAQVRAAFDWMNPNVLESIIGLIVPVVLLAIMELWARYKGTTDKGYERIASMKDPSADVEPSPEMKRAVKHFSHMAITCFVVTLVCISALLIGLLCFEEYTPSVERIMKWGCAIMLGISVAYAIYRIIDARRTA